MPLLTLDHILIVFNYMSIFQILTIKYRNSCSNDVVATQINANTQQLLQEALITGIKPEIY